MTPPVCARHGSTAHALLRVATLGCGVAALAFGAEGCPVTDHEWTSRACVVAGAGLLAFGAWPRRPMRLAAPFAPEAGPFLSNTFVRIAFVAVGVLPFVVPARHGMRWLGLEGRRRDFTDIGVSGQVGPRWLRHPWVRAGSAWDARWLWPYVIISLGLGFVALGAWPRRGRTHVRPGAATRRTWRPGHPGGTHKRCPPRPRLD